MSEHDQGKVIRNHEANGGGPLLSPTQSFPGRDEDTAGRAADTDRRSEAAAGPSPEALNYPSRIGAFRIVEEIARGGMGAILRAQDPDFDRPLAIKVILPRYCGKPEVERRFLDEARITGRLQHPGVPPVHQLGRLADGRPYFAMKLVEGRTFAGELRESRSRTDVTALLEVLESVGQTVAYSHECGVIHRDLKPQNVMVGAFGEVQVMDWGLAKQIAAKSRAVASTESGASESESSAELTHHGAVIGTPAYMAPEQARGDAASVDEQSDVFALGAMLCEILTGRPPFRGDTPQEILHRAAEGDWSEARAELDRCGAAPQLVQLTKASLAADRRDRVPRALDFVKALGDHRRDIEERLRQVELARVEAEARADEAARRRTIERQRDRLWLSLAIVILLLVAAAGWGAHSMQRRAAEQARRLATQQQDAARILERVASLRRLGHVREARVALDSGLPVLRSIPVSEIGQLAANENRLLDFLQQLDDLKFQRARVLDQSSLSEARNEVSQAYAQLFADSGLMKLGDAPEVSARRIAASELRDELLVALDYWVSATREPRLQQQLLQTAKLLDPHPIRDALRSLESWNDPKRLLDAVSTVEAKDWTPSLLTATVLQGGLIGSPQENAVHADVGEGASEAIAQLLGKMVRRYPRDYWLARLAAMSFAQAGRDEEAAELMHSALALRPDVLSLRGMLARMLTKAGRQVEALEMLRAAAKDHPESAEIHDALARSLAQSEQTEEALAHHREAVRLQPREAKYFLNLGKTLLSRERMQEAEAALLEAERLLTEDESTGVIFEVYLQLALVVNFLRQDPLQTIDYVRRALRQSGWPRPSSAHGTAPALLYENLMALERYEEAIDVIKIALQCWQVDEDDQEELEDVKTSFRFDALHRLGVSLIQVGRYTEATAPLQEALQLTGTDPKVRERIKELLEWNEETIARDEFVDEVLAGRAEFKDNTERIEVAHFCLDTRRYVTALRLFQQAMEEDPSLAATASPESVVDSAAQAAAWVAQTSGRDQIELTDVQKLEHLRLAHPWMAELLADMKQFPFDQQPVEVLMAAREMIDRIMAHPAHAALQSPEELMKWPEQDQQAWLRLWREWNEMAAMLDNMIKTLNDKVGNVKIRDRFVTALVEEPNLDELLRKVVSAAQQGLAGQRPQLDAAEIRDQVSSDGFHRVLAGWACTEPDTLGKLAPFSRKSPGPEAYAIRGTTSWPNGF